MRFLPSTAKFAQSEGQTTANNRDQNMNKPKLKQYKWWGKGDDPPENLKTKKQLAQLGLKPKSPRAFIDTPKYYLYLYDINDSESVFPKKKATEAQLKALEKGRQTQKEKSLYRVWNKNKGRHIRAKNHEIKWAMKVLQEKEKWVVLDTETTGLYNAEIVQIGIIDLEGKTLLDQLIKPNRQIPKDAINIHGISNNTVKFAPNFREVYPRFKAVCKDKNILIYNASYDIQVIDNCCHINNLEKDWQDGDIYCVMESYAKYWGDWSDHYKSYRWQKLEGDHSAIGDCLATLKLLRKIANSQIVDTSKAFTEYKKIIENY